ncbi:MAG TPA: glycosyltransferase family 39 protein, partial [Thermoanaerobaculia bacterium]|nr:glycosyltransferase family 39 protein [Thermoanaerobaculia bacterium]
MRPYLIAAAAFIAFLALAISDVFTTSATTDEGVHLASGLSYRSGDYRLNPEHPPLLKRFATLFVAQPSFDGAAQARQKVDEAWAGAESDAMAQWTYSHYTLWGLRDSHFGAATTELPPKSAWVADAPAMFTRARLTMLACGVALALLVFFWSRALWGAWGAALSAALFCLDPNFIAHSGLVTTDVGVSLFMFAAVFFLWRALQRFTVVDVTGFAIAFGCAQAAKFSAILLLPIVV